MDNSAYINRALEYISKAWNTENLSLEKIAGEAGFSAGDFDRMFAESTEISVMEYVRIYKLICSARMLRTSHKSILDIALELGYTNPENYARAFKAVYELSPSEYRQKHANMELSWKDISTGTVIRRSENVYPKLVDADELTEHLVTSAPVRYAPDIYQISRSDCAVYRLRDEDEYILVQECRPDEMSLTLFCSQ